MSSNRRSSRSSGGSSEVSEKRSAAYEPEVIEGIGELNNNYSRKVFKISTDEMKNQKELSMIGVEFPKPSIKESDSYYKMSEDQRNKCCRLVVRLLLMKAARNESVTRAVVADVLASFDPIYKKHVSVVISEAKVILSATFGYNLLCGSQISLNGRRDEFYLVNELDSPTLYAVLAESRKINDNAFVGFVYVILQIIFSSPGRKCDVRTLLRNVRKIDNRFPEMVVKGKDKSTAISELEVDFLSLLARMKKEGYITLDKDSLDEVDNDLNKVVYTFGTRFYADFGLITLLRSHSQASGEVIDARTLKDLEEEITQQRAGGSQEENDA